MHMPWVSFGGLIAWHLRHTRSLPWKAQKRLPLARGALQPRQ